MLKRFNYYHNNYNNNSFPFLQIFINMWIDYIRFQPHWWQFSANYNECIGSPVNNYSNTYTNKTTAKFKAVVPKLTTTVHLAIYICIYVHMQLYECIVWTETAIQRSMQWSRIIIAFANKMDYLKVVTELAQECTMSYKYRCIGAVKFSVTVDVTVRT